MTNLYETLGVTQDATKEEIVNAFERLSKFFDPNAAGDAGNTLADDPIMIIYFDDISLAYKTLVNNASRAEYDEYISQNQRISNYWDSNTKNDEEADPEVLAERERRRKERGKKRFEEDHSFVNEEFFTSWQNRTSNFKSTFQTDPKAGEKTLETMFDGGDLHADVELSFAEVI